MKDTILTEVSRLTDAGEYAAAARQLRRLLSDPHEASNPQLWQKIAEAEELAGQRDAAIEAYQQTARLFAERGAYLPAENIYRRKLLVLAPETLSARLHLAELYHSMGLSEDAMEQFLILAGHYEQHGRMDECKDILRRVIQLKPTNLIAKLKLAELYNASKEKEQAAEVLSQICQQLWAIGQHEDFVKVAERLVFLKPDDLVHTRMLIEALLMLGNPRRALQHLQRALQIAPEDIQGLTLLAQVFERLEQGSKAVQVLHELARVHDQKGNITERNQIYQEILRRAPGDREAKSALGTSDPDLAQQASGTPRPVSAPVPFADQGTEWERTPTRDVKREAPTEPIPAASTAANNQADRSAQPKKPEGPEVTSGSSPPGPGGPNQLGGAPAAADGQARSPAPTEAAPRLPRPGFIAPLGAAPPTDQAVAPTPAGGPPGRRDSSRGRPTGATGTPNEEIIRLLTETRVYIKYGLRQKAMVHITKILTQDPTNLEALLCRKEVLLADGDHEAAALVLMRLAELTRSQPELSTRYAREAQELTSGEELGAPGSSPGLPGSASAGRRPTPFIRSATPGAPRSRSGGRVPSPPPKSLGTPDDPIPLTTRLPAGPRQALVVNPDRATAAGLNPRQALVVGPARPSAREGGRALEGQQPPQPGRPGLPPVPPGSEASGPPQRPLKPPPRHPALPRIDAQQRIRQAMREAEFSLQEGQVEDAIGAYEEVLKLDPNHLEARRRLNQLQKRDTIPEQPVRPIRAAGQLAQPPRPLQPAAMVQPPRSMSLPRPGLSPLPGTLPARPASPPPTPPRRPPSGPPLSTPAPPKAASTVAPAPPVPSDTPAPPAALTLGAAPPAAMAPAPAQTMRPSEAPPSTPAPSAATATAPPPSAAPLSAAPPQAPEAPARHPVEAERDGQTHFDSGIAYMEMELYPRAIEEFQAAMAAGVKSTECYRHIGQCHLKSGNPGEALRWLRRGLGTRGISQSERLGLFFTLGEAFLTQNNVAEAKHYFQKVAEEEPTYPGLKIHLARLGIQPPAEK